MKRILFFAFLCLCVCLSAGAQALSPVTWTAYGLTFKVPKGIVVEEDTEETFLLNDSKFYITVQALDCTTKRRKASVPTPVPATSATCRPTGTSTR